jgi:2',3'-cyclic-nucleotide 2'-phosphodiesterase (5'-nucleotidase family)
VLPGDKIVSSVIMWMGMRNTLVTLFLLSLLGACGTTQKPLAVSFYDYSVGKQQPPDTGMLALLKPYSSKLDATMNTVIGFATGTLNKKQPESGLGNFMADAMKQMAEKKFGIPVDAAFMNDGGIRSYIPKGNITTGKIYELMPFDNLVVTQEVSGVVLLRFLDKTASDGGWPVSSGVQMGIKDKKAVNVLLNGKPIDPAGKYTIVNSDYVANGGSDCDMLRGIPYRNKGYLLRDALIEYISALTKQGKPLEPIIENRVTHAN